MKHLKKFITKTIHMGLSRIMRNDQEFRNLIFWIRNRRRINLANPVTFSDKLNWMMSHTDYRRYASLADKYKVREIIKEKGYSHYLNQVYGIYSSELEIEFDTLPMSFVLKPSHGSNMVLICRDKTRMHLEKVRKTCKRWLKTDYSKLEHEIIYADIPHRILCEKLLQDEFGKVPIDFKIYCFLGKAKFIGIDFDRFVNHTISIYNRDWQLTSFSWGFQINPNPLPRPARLEEMIYFAEDISKEYPFVRVDLYLVDDRIIFGELTFTPSAGTMRIDYSYDKTLGDCLDLTEVQARP